MNDLPNNTESLGFWLAKAMDMLEDKLEIEISALDQRIEQKFTLRDSVVLARQEVVNVSLKAVEDSASAALASSNLAMVKAENQAEKRWDGANEFRATLSDQAARLATKEELNSVKERITMLEGRDIGTVAHKAGSHQNTTLMVAVITALIALVALLALFLHH